MTKNYEQQPRFIFQDVVATCPQCRREKISIVSLDTEPGLRWSRHFRSVNPMEVLAFCGGSMAYFERATANGRR